MKSIFLLMLAAALLPACSPTKSDISDKPVPNNQVYIMAGAQVSSPSNTGTAPYTVFCQLQYTDTSESNSDFNSASVTVNGVTLRRVYQDGYFQNLGTTMTLSEGDSLEFVIKHSKTGTIKQVVYVPPPLPEVSVSPGFSVANVPNTAATFTLSWTPVAADFYLVEASGYNYWQTALAADTTFVSSSGNATVVLRDSSGDACPWIYIRVQSFNYIPLAGFAEGSGLGASGAFYKSNSNMPNVGSAVRANSGRERRIGS